MSLLPRSSSAVAVDASSPAFGRWLDEAHLTTLGLTPRECEVMRWMSEGKRDREIATILGLSRRTVEKHVCHIFTKLGVETRTAAARECQFSYLRSDRRSSSSEQSASAAPKKGKAGRLETTPRHRPRAGST